MKKLFIFTIILSWIVTGLYSQCSNTNKYPTEDIQAPIYLGDTVLVSNVNWAGDYYTIKGLTIGETYVFMSSANPADYLTIRDEYGGLLTHGTSPLSWTVSGVDMANVHINLVSPPCGTENVNRTTKVTCTTCPAIPPGVGVGTTDPQSDLDVDGQIKLGKSNRPAQAGMIRWNNTTQDFEGYNGSHWVSLTKGKASWGQVNPSQSSENQKNTASDGAAFDNFGYSVSISGDYAVVGAFDAEVGGNSGQGVAYIFHRSGTNWTQQSKLTSNDGAAGDRFGWSVSISGDYAVVGAYFAVVGGNFGQGAAYIFYRSGTSWTPQAKLTASDGAAGDYFGTSVSVSGDYAVIGADHADVGGNSNQGSAYIFHRSGTNWNQQSKLTSNDGAADDRFGFSVSISGDYAVVGAYFADVGGNNNQGSAYIFYRSGTSWTQQAKLTASDGVAGDYFGFSVSVSGDYAVVGAYNADISGNNNQGSAYIFHRSGTDWSQQSKLTASDGAAFDEFGYSVSVSGDYAVVGANGADVGGNIDQGAVYFFNK